MLLKGKKRKEQTRKEKKRKEKKRKEKKRKEKKRKEKKRKEKKRKEKKKKKRKEKKAETFVFFSHRCCVERTCRFVHQDDRSVLQQSASNRNTLLKQKLKITPLYLF
jgi:hypothetical protein